MDLMTVVQGAMDEARPTAEAKGVTLTLTRLTALQPVVGDSARLQQVVGNLLSNAVKFTPSGGHVEVLLTASDSEMEIRVTDTGQGISPDVLPQVFDRFVQADSSSTRRQGGSASAWRSCARWSRRTAEPFGPSARAWATGRPSRYGCEVFLSRGSITSVGPSRRRSNL